MVRVTWKRGEKSEEATINLSTATTTTTTTTKSDGAIH